MSDSFLELRNLKKSFTSEEYVLQGINLQIDQGEFVTLLGASGCGKTTTLRIIAGLEQPDSGSVWLEGKDVTNLEPNQRDVITVFQIYALFPHMNVADNIGYGLKIRKVPKADIKKKVKEMLELVQLEGFEKRKPAELSGGQKQRVAIARALATASGRASRSSGSAASADDAIGTEATAEEAWNYLYLYHPRPGRGH